MLDGRSPFPNNYQQQEKQNEQLGVKQFCEPQQPSYLPNFQNNYYQNIKAPQSQSQHFQRSIQGTNTLNSQQLQSQFPKYTPAAQYHQLGDSNPQGKQQHFQQMHNRANPNWISNNNQTIGNSNLQQGDKQQNPNMPNITKRTTEQLYELIPQRIGEKNTWRANINKILGKGSYGILCIASCYNLPDSAVKFEEMPKSNATRKPVLYYDQQFLHYFNLQKNLRTPELFEYGCKNGFYYLVMSLHGPNINDCLKKAPSFYDEYGVKVSKMSLKTKLLLCLGMFDCVKSIHENGIIHRDLKPDNFVIGKSGQLKTVFIIDFGLSKQYMNQGIHIRFRGHKDLTGTARYVSSNTHKGFEQSRRDDIESLGNVFLFMLLNQKLPWIGLNCVDRATQFKKIAEIKENVNLYELCYRFPEMEKYLKKAKKMYFEDEPDYAFLRNCLVNTATANGIELNENYPVYDWDLDPSFYASLKTEFERIDYPPPTRTSG